MLTSFCEQVSVVHSSCIYWRKLCEVIAFSTSLTICWKKLASLLPREKFCYGWLHRRLLRRYRPQSAVNCSTLWERAAGSSPNTSQVSLFHNAFAYLNWFASNKIGAAAGHWGFWVDVLNFVLLGAAAERCGTLTTRSQVLFHQRSELSSVLLEQISSGLPSICIYIGAVAALN